jgi:hypothetical protein
MSNQSILKKPVFWVALLGLGAAGYFLTEPEATKGGSVKAAPRKKAAVKPGNTSVVFTEEDEKASFNRVSEPPRDAFRPIVARRGGIGGGDGLANGLPADFAGGEGNWVYTGSAEIDGVTSALLENRTSGEGVFLKRGERWKSASVISVGNRSIVMRGPSGTRTFTMVDEESAPGRMASSSSGGTFATSGGNNGFAPVNPGLRGPIGSLPVPSGNGNNIMVAPAATAPMPGGITMEQQGEMNGGN